MGLFGLPLNNSGALAEIKRIIPWDEPQFYDQLRTIKGFEAIPAILMTASGGIPWSHIEKRQMVGIAKPLELSAFLATIEKLLRQEG